jgi:thiol-disulfide isomerase/thioredoxin
MKTKTILLIYFSFFYISFVLGQNMEAKSILYKSVWKRNSLQVFTADVHYFGREVGENKEYSGKRTLLVNKKGSFFEKRQNATQKFPDYTYELGDSIFYCYFDPSDSTFIYLEDLKEEYSRNYGLNSFNVKQSLGRFLDSTWTSILDPYAVDTIVMGRHVWSLKVSNLLFPNGYNNWFVFISKDDTIPIGSYKHEVSLAGDTTYSFSFIDSLNFDIERQILLERLYLKEINELKRYRLRRNYNSFVLDPSQYSGFVSELTAFNFSILDSVHLNFNRGKYLIDFWYVGCFPCTQSFPYLEALEKTYANKGVEFIKFNPVNFNDPAKVARFSRRHLIEENNYIVPKKICNNFGVSTYPTFLFIEDGVIIKKIEGFDESVYEELKKYLEIWTAK